ncbi:MAG: hypothetical protein RL697_660 [Pseudomonadota bacterium]|jgi:hypothetical protein|uniref:DUF1178 family protein n=1 Tax=Limnohabitans sp. TaxID=1907725 RepID=UPI00311FEC07
MKVLDLQCSHGHVFEGWFASHDDYESQRERGLLTCPVCEDAQVNKMLSAPRLNLAQTPPQQIQAAMLKMVRHVMANTEDVGNRFAEEARKIHHGEAQERSIRGQASREETEALLDEGIDILPLPVPAGLKEPLQ